MWVFRGVILKCRLVGRSSKAIHSRLLNHWILPKQKMMKLRLVWIQSIAYDFLGCLLSQWLCFLICEAWGFHIFISQLCRMFRNFVFHQPGFLSDSACSSEPHLVLGILLTLSKMPIVRVRKAFQGHMFPTMLSWKFRWPTRHCYTHPPRNSRPHLGDYEAQNCP